MKRNIDWAMILIRAADAVVWGLIILLVMSVAIHAS